MMASRILKEHDHRSFLIRWFDAMLAGSPGVTGESSVRHRRRRRLDLVAIPLAIRLLLGLAFAVGVFVVAIVPNYWL
jgi:hypothetical protein